MVKRGFMIHECNVCEKKEEWKEGWTWRFIMYKDVRHTEAGYEETYKMCSEPCRLKAEKKVKWVVKV